MCFAVITLGLFVVDCSRSGLTLGLHCVRYCYLSGGLGWLGLGISFVLLFVSYGFMVVCF